MDHSRKMLRFRDMLLFLNPPTQHEALLQARSASLRCARKYPKSIEPCRLPFLRVNTVRINYQRIDVWNNIPENIRSLDAIKKFKSALIKYFLSEY